MISLEGLTLTTGRHAEAGYILRTFAHYVRDGLIPNLLPRGRAARASTTPPTPRSGSSTPLDRYLDATGDRATLRLLLPKLRGHRRAPPARHALRHRRRPGRRPAAPGGGGLPAHLDGRQGRRLGGDAAARQGGRDQRPLVQRPAPARRLGRARSRRRDEAPPTAATHAERVPRVVQPALLERGGRATSTTWSTAKGRRRPGAAGRTSSSPSRSTTRSSTRRAGSRCWTWSRERLLTPVGLRSLAPGHPDYKPKYYGDLRARDAAYHQGTVWGWLIGPFVDAWLKVHPGRPRRGATACSTGFVPHLGEACVGSISEVFDAEAPYTPRGCIAQAWSVAEVLRGWLKPRDIAGIDLAAQYRKLARRKPMADRSRDILTGLFLVCDAAERAYGADVPRIRQDDVSLLMSEDTRQRLFTKTRIGHRVRHQGRRGRGIGRRHRRRARRPARRPRRGVASRCRACRSSRPAPWPPPWPAAPPAVRSVGSSGP